MFHLGTERQVEASSAQTDGVTVQLDTWLVILTWVGWAGESNIAVSTREASGTGATTSVSSSRDASASIMTRVVLTEWESCFAKSSLENQTRH